MRETPLRGRRALITGASSGLGADFARELGARGCDLVLVARREERLRTVRDEIVGEYGVEAEVIPMDLLEERAPDRLHERTEGAGRAIDVLVNNAGFGVYGTFVEIPWERERRMLDLDIRVPVHLTKLFVPEMVARGSGRVLQIASIGAYQSVPTYASYSAAKSFILRFGEAIDYELRGTGVSCTVLSPGITATEFLEVSGQRPSLYQRLLMMQSEEVARVGIEAMLKRRSSVVPGLVNKLSVQANRLLPRRLATAIGHLLMTKR